ncbi:hypothetical protein SH661x_001620 [Planctomicrobium sp. SH661]|uniref:hypothetical protein n=1 Tax=Planctomicrobium sp. SH661 TaxID=3448124 RepID=UPI003F5B9B93
MQEQDLLNQCDEIAGDIASLVDVTCPMLADDVHQIGTVADRLGVSVPQAMSMAVRLLGSCWADGVLRSDGETNFIIARCQNLVDRRLPDIYRRVHF